MIPIITSSQSHGFIWENEIRKKVFLLPTETNNTDKYDIPCEQNSFNQNENCSIKTTGSETIYCGDILSFYNYDFSKTNTIICLKYIQSDSNKILQEIYEINYNKEMRDILFGNISYDKLKEYVDSVKSIPYGVNTDKTYLKTKDDLQKIYNMTIHIAPKVDSKNQRRVQCSISNFTKILESFIKYRTTEPIIRGKEISKSIVSEKRKRNIKTALFH